MVFVLSLFVPCLLFLMPRESLTVASSFPGYHYINFYFVYAFYDYYVSLVNDKKIKYIENRYYAK